MENPIAYTENARREAIAEFEKFQSKPCGAGHLAKKWAEQLANPRLFIGTRAVAFAGLDWLAGKDHSM